MKKLLTTAVLLAAALAAHAQTWVDGEVRKVDKPQAKLTLRHAEIKEMDMPAMTMVWRVKDPAMLDGLAEGKRVRFTAAKIDGQFTVLQIQPAN